MLSYPKTFTTFCSQIPRTYQHRYAPSFIIKSSSDNGNNIASEDDLNASQPVQRPTTPPETVEIRFRRGSRKRRKQQQDRVADKMQSKQAPVRKDWDSMTLGEKAIELYMGERGALYWLNKFAYASIFIVIGGWILFRFIGPAINLYQLDSPPLSATSMFKG